jgi:hypothetical protein
MDTLSIPRSPKSPKNIKISNIDLPKGQKKKVSIFGILEAGNEKV